jgi:hypothetical protein
MPYVIALDNSEVTLAEAFIRQHGNVRVRAVADYLKTSVSECVKILNEIPDIEFTKIKALEYRQVMGVRIK